MTRINLMDLSISLRYGSWHTGLGGKGSSHSFVVLQILEQVSPNPEEVHCGAALGYPDRNRSQNFLPGKSIHI